MSLHPPSVGGLHDQSVLSFVPTQCPVSVFNATHSLLCNKTNNVFVFRKRTVVVAVVVDVDDDDNDDGKKVIKDNENKKLEKKQTLEIVILAATNEEGRTGGSNSPTSNWPTMLCQIAK